MLLSEHLIYKTQPLLIVDLVPSDHVISLSSDILV